MNDQFKELRFSFINWFSRFLLRFSNEEEENEDSDFCSDFLLEYRRLHFLTPAVEAQTLRGHKDEVLHVAFAGNGEQIASCSKVKKMRMSSVLFEDWTEEKYSKKSWIIWKTFKVHVKIRKSHFISFWEVSSSFFFRAKEFFSWF